LRRRLRRQTLEEAKNKNNKNKTKKKEQIKQELQQVEIN